MTLLAARDAPVVDVGIATTLFGPPHPLAGSTGGWYELRRCDLDPAADPDVEQAQQLPDDTLAGADTVVVAAGPRVPPEPSPAVVRALRAAHAQQARIVSLGAGAFVLAAAGLLAGLRATTHWSVCDELRRRHPDVLVDDHVLHVEDGGILTSAGAAATLDLCLELIHRDHGAAVANSLARWMVAPPRRSGEHRQFVAAPLDETDDGFVRVVDWASGRLDQPVTLADMAKIAGVSPRTLSRRFHVVMGTSPLQWLLAQRIRLAQELLESSRYSAERIAGLSGFGTVANLRQHFTRAVGVSPQRYRRMRRGTDG